VEVQALFALLKRLLCLIMHFLCLLYLGCWMCSPSWEGQAGYWGHMEAAVASGEFDYSSSVNYLSEEK